ncbi:protein amalgam [Procambarus clarkii]|uniref:protein amalgam n=1 Tax=Procambarus clarkii TaxID=6728 RepID=UPI001E677F4E|nr:protein amalgam-like [Procambarus clarkii]
METSLAGTLVTLLLLTPQGLSRGYSDQYSYSDYDTGRDGYYSAFSGREEEEVPTFLARPQSFTVEVGQSVIIPCDAERTGTNKLIIKKIPPNGGKEKLIWVGSERVTQDHRITVDGFRLNLSNVQPRDAGTFLCMFEMEQPVQLRHTLNVQFAPTIRSLAPPEQHVTKGTTVTLECEAQGNPQPIIRWSRQEGPLPSGHRTQQGRSLRLEGLDLGMDGTYLCSADNGIGEAASTAMTITVEYPPEVTAEKGIVRSGEGDRVELACVVRGQPVPDVFWTRDGHPLPYTNMDTKFHLLGHHNRSQDFHTAHLSLAHAAHRHVLVVDRVTEKDFGAYICIARNTHGQKEAVIQMTGLPKPPQVTSSPNGGEGTRYTLTWQTESYYPITEFLIKYRKTHLGPWQANGTMVMPGAWETITGAVDSGKLLPHTRHALAYTVMGLEVATDYEAIIRVRNKYGWSAPSPHFSFSTKKAMAVLQSTRAAAGDATLATPAPLFLLTVFLAKL